jgi:hypothetical protein
MRMRTFVEARFPRDFTMGFIDWIVGWPDILCRLYKLHGYEHHDSAGAHRIPWRDL